MANSKNKRFFETLTLTFKRKAITKVDFVILSEKQQLISNDKNLSILFNTNKKQIKASKTKNDQQLGKITYSQYENKIFFSAIQVIKFCQTLYNKSIWKFTQNMNTQLNLMAKQAIFKQFLIISESLTTNQSFIQYFEIQQNVDNLTLLIMYLKGFHMKSKEWFGSSSDKYLMLVVQMLKQYQGRNQNQYVRLIQICQDLVLTIDESEDAIYIQEQVNNFSEQYCIEKHKRLQENVKRKITRIFQRSSFIRSFI